MFDYQRFGLIYVQVLPRQWHLGVRVKGGGKPLGSAVEGTVAALLTAKVLKI